MQKQIKYFNTYEIKDLKDMLLKTVARNSNKVAFKIKTDDGKIVNKTFKEFKEDVEGLTTKLIKMNLKNKRIAVMGKNSYSWAISYLSATIIGVVVPIDKESTDGNVVDFINKSRAEVLIADDKYLKRIKLLEKNLTNEITFLSTEKKSTKYLNIFSLIDERKKNDFKWK